MTYECGCMKTIEIDTVFFTYLTQAELNRRCHEPNSGSEVSNPWHKSYLETGDRDIDDEEDEDDQREVEDPTPYIDYSMTGLDPEGYE